MKSHSAAASGSSQSETEWRTLFDGSSLANWRGVDGETLPAGWGISNGVIKNSGGEQYLITRDSFEDFELELEWKADLKGNGGDFCIILTRTAASVAGHSGQTCRRSTIGALTCFIMIEKALSAEYGAVPAIMWKREHPRL